MPVYTASVPVSLSQQPAASSSSGKSRGNYDKNDGVVSLTLEIYAYCPHRYDREAPPGRGATPQDLGYWAGGGLIAGQGVVAELARRREQPKIAAGG
eukprot:COSAG01_NODE_5941_length_3941_cov_6.953930_2_plen_97_part_00